MIQHVSQPLSKLSRSSQALIRKALSASFLRPYSPSSSRQSCNAVRLKSRALIKLDGPDGLSLLQGLITNDVGHLTSRSSIYSLFLNNQGRVLYDTIIYKTTNDGTLVECDVKVKESLIKHLKTFRLRKNVEISDASEGTKDPLDLWVIFERSPGVTKEVASVDLDNPAVTSFTDPRMPSLGQRLIVPRSTTILSPEAASDETSYAQLRYALGVAEGVDELPPGVCFPLESNADFLHGVSFHKGCYLGQELTARTHHTGVIRKRIMPIRFLENHELSDIDPSALSLVTDSSKSIGKIRGVSGSFAIGLVRIEPALSAVSLQVTYQNQSVPVLIEKPFWWPKESSPSPDRD